MKCQGAPNHIEGKKSGPVVKKQIRLFSFQAYDETPSKSNENSSDEDKDKESRYKDKQQFVIQMFGLNEKGETFCIYIRDFAPFFYVSVGGNWTAYNMRCLVDEIKKKLPKNMQESIIGTELVDFNKLYGFCAGKKSRFIKFTFKNSIVMRKVRSFWIEYIDDADRPGKSKSRMRPFVFQGINIELYESNIPPLLRYFHINNISPSGWVEIPANRVERVEHKTTTCKYEFVCTANQLKPLPDKETPVPYKICSFDIEANSSHGDFPVPIKTYKRLAMNMVDSYIRQKDFLDLAKTRTMLQRMILTAFGYDVFEDIDIVYPKNKPTKDQIKKYIKVLLEEPMEIAKYANKDQDTAHLLTIDEMFEQIKDRIKFTGDNEAESSEMIPNDVGAEEGAAFRFQKKAAKRVDVKSTVVDMLLSENYTRDEKIQLFNDVLTRLFPQLEGDQITCIGSTFMRYGEADTYLNHCLVLGTCDDVEGATIEAVDDERDLLVRWAELIQSEDPDIIIGYNIFGFDYEFMLRRSQELHCEQEFLNVSRKVNEFCGVYDKEDTLQLENTPLRLATGDYDLKYFKLSGRLQIDMYTYFRREYNLPSYKLDYVAGENICDSIVSIMHTKNESGQETTELYSKNLTGLHINDFIHIGYVGFTSDYYKNGDKFRVLDIKRGVEVTETVKGEEIVNKYNVIVIEGHEHIDTKRPVKWGSAKDDVSPQDISRLFKTDATGRAVVAKYCIQDCNLVHYIMNKIDVLTGFVEMASICSVPMSFLVFRGQGIKLTSFVAKKCMENNTLMPELEKGGDDSGYEGAIVLPPKCSMYMDDPVACVDYASLYPSAMSSQNLSHDSKVWTKEFDLTGNLLRETGEKSGDGSYKYDKLEGYKYIDLEFDSFRYIRKTPTSRAEKVKSGTKVCRWAQFPDGKKGILPSILEELLKARADTRKKQKTEKDPFMWNILEKRQLGYKVTANSLYGQCGSPTSAFCEKDIAASTTATGRMMINYARRIIEEVYGNRLYVLENGETVKTKAEYVYGDTDSVFFTFNLEHPETGEKIRGKPALEITIEIAQDAAKLCSQWLKAPMELSYEKTLMPFILVAKKKYVGMLYETDPNKGKLKYMGLSIKRRDSCDYLKDVYGGILNILMKEYDIKKAIQFLDSSLTALLKGQVPTDKLMMTKQLKSDYKNPERMEHWVLSDRIGKRDPGNKPKSGDRIKFLHFVNPQAKLNGERIETPEFIKENNLSIDYTYYITNQLMKPLQQLFSLALEQIWEMNNKGTVLRKHRKEVAELEKQYEDRTVFMKKREIMCCKKIKELLFDKYLEQIRNEKTGIQTITNFFKKN
jgi:DNA polymerase elongation subunit (family B)